MLFRSLGKWETTKTVRVIEDSRISISDADRAARRQALNRLTDLAREADRARIQIVALRTSLNNAVQAWKRAGSASPEASGRPGGPRIPDEIRKDAEELLKNVEEVCQKFASRQQCTQAEGEGQGSAGPPLVFQPTPLPNRIGQ